jgi:hypothetical protein
MNEKGIRVPKKQSATARVEEMRDRFCERVVELWDLHQSEFMGYIEESEEHKANVIFTARIDLSDSSAKLQSSIRASQVLKDRKEDDFDDPNQGALGDIPEEAREETKKRKGKGGKKPRGKKPPSTFNDEISGKDAAAGEREEG